MPVGSAASPSPQRPWRWSMRSCWKPALIKQSSAKDILASCFVTDLGTVIALGLLFAPFTYKTLVFIVGSHGRADDVALHYRVADATLCASYGCDQNEMGHADALWIGRAGAVVGERSGFPAYLAGMVLAGSAARDTHWIRRLRTLTVGFLTPFYFLRAGTLGVPARSPCRSIRVSRVAHGESGVEDFWPLSLYQSFPSGPQGTLVLHTLDVHRLDVWDDFFSLRPDTWSW